MIDKKTMELAYAAIQSHPLKIEAFTWEYCVSDVFVASKNILSKANVPEAVKLSLTQSLADTEEVLIVVYHTAERKPEPLSGYGKSYNFAIHPTTYELLLADVGTWRS